MLFCLFANVKTSYCQQYTIAPSLINQHLLQNSIVGMAKDDAGFLWVVTQFGCYRYDGYNTITYQTSNTSFLTSDRYSRIFNDKKHHRLIVVGEHDYYFVTGGSLKRNQYPDSVLIFGNEDYLFLPKNRLKNILGNEINFTQFGSTIFISGKDTLLCWDTLGYNLSKNAFLPKKVYQPCINHTTFVRDGRTYSIDNTGLYELLFKNEKIQKKIITSLKGFERKLHDSNEEDIWAENEDKIIKINLPSGNIIKTLHKNEIGQSTISILDDNESGTIYQGSVSKGINEYHTFHVKILDSANYLSSYCYTNLLKSYCLISENGISFFPHQAQKKSLLFKQESIPFSIFADRQQRIWFQTIQKKIACFNPTTNKIVNTLDIDELMVDVKQTDNDVFFFANHNKLVKYDLQLRSKVVYFTCAPNVLITSFSMHNHTFYISTTNGVYVLDANKKLISHFLPETPVRRTLQLKNGILAIATYGKGLFYLQNNTLYTTVTNQYPSLNAAVSLSLDADGALWVICNKGAFIWDKPGILINNHIPSPDHALYVEKDLPCTELNGGLSPDSFPTNEIALTSSNGLLVFKKEDLIKRKVFNNITLRTVMINDSIINKITDFEVPAGTADLKFNFDAVYLHHETKLLAAYRINELDSQWIEFPESRVIDLSRLPRGHFTLEIRYSPKDKAITVSHFTVRPYWYQTYRALAGIMVALIVLIYLIFKIYFRRQQIKQLTLERIIKEKTNALQENLVKLSASEKEIKSQYRYRNKLYSILMHDLRSPLKFLSTYSLQQVEKQRKNEIDPDSMSIIAEASHDLDGFINDFLYWLRHQNNENKLSIKETNIVEILQELTAFFQPVALMNHNKLFYFETQAVILFNTDSDRLKIIVRNLLDNANKYTTNGIIKLSASIDEKNKLVIKIEDSGSGVPAAIRDAINSSSTLSELNPSNTINSKMGLLISKEFTHQMHGTIRVEAEENMGSVFTLRFRSLD